MINQRCHRRKQRCDGNAQCQPCQVAGVNCTTTDKTSQRTITRSHVPELEEVSRSERCYGQATDLSKRIRWLEDLIISHNGPEGANIRCIETNTNISMSASCKKPSSYLTDPPQRLRAGSPPTAVAAETDLTRLDFPEELEPKGNLFLDPSLESGDAYIPPTAPSAYGVFARNHQIFEDDQEQISSASKILASTIRTNSRTERTASPKAVYPPLDLAKRFCDSYFHHTHTQAPYLHHASFQRFFIQFYSTDFIEEQPSWLFIMNMYTLRLTTWQTSS